MYNNIHIKAATHRDFAKQVSKAEGKGYQPMLTACGTMSTTPYFRTIGDRIFMYQTYCHKSLPKHLRMAKSTYRDDIGRAVGE